MIHTAIYAAAYGNDKAIQLALSPSGIAQTICGADNLVVVGNGLAIVTATAKDLVNHRFAYRDGTIREGIPTFHRFQTAEAVVRHGLEILRVDSQSCTVVDSFDYSDFVKAAILRQTLALEGFLKLLVAHCASRSVGDKKLSSIASIQLRLAEVAQIISMIKAVLGQNYSNNSAVHEELSCLLSKASDLLIKTAGARSMLSGGLVEMHFLFSIFNDIYVCCDE